MTDALKLVWAERAFFPGQPVRKILALADDAAADHFRAASLDVGGPGRLRH